MVEEREAHAVLRAHAVGTRQPARRIEEAVRRVDVLDEAGVVGGGRIGRGRRQDVADGPAGRAVSGFDQRPAVEGEGQRPAHRRVRQEGMCVGRS